MVDTSFPRAVEVARTCVIDCSTGIATVSVAMTELAAQHGDIVFAEVSTPYCAARGDDHAATDRGNLEILQTETPDRRLRFSASAQSGATFKTCTWSYIISNAVPYTQADLQHLSPKYPGHENIPANYSARPHTLRIACQRFRLELRFINTSRAIHQAIAIVEREKAPGRWERDPALEAAAIIQLDPSGLSAQLTVTNPIPELRYSIAFIPSNPGESARTEVLRLTERVLRQCRSERSFEDTLSGMLRARFAEELAGALESTGKAPDFRDATSWVVLLWNRKRSMLMSATGDFPHQQWSVRFYYGKGVAGHAFRFQQPALFTEGDSPKFSLIYQSKTDQNVPYSAEYTWVVCLPLLEKIGGASVGVLSFAGTNPITDHEKRLADCAANLGDSSALLGDLVWRISAAFWDVIAT